MSIAKEIFALLSMKGIFLPKEELEKATAKAKASRNYFQVINEIEKEYEGKFQKRNEGAYQTTEPYEHQKKKRKEVLQYKDGKLVATHDSISAAARAIGGVHNKGNIHNCCKGNGKTFLGFEWKFK